MADYVAARITIGGSVRRRLVPQLCEVICRQGVGLEWGEIDFCPKSAADLLAARCDISGCQVLPLHSDEVAYGNFHRLREFLERHKLPFDRWHESKYEISCGLMVYRPGHPLRSFLTDFQGEIVVRAAPLLGLADLVTKTQQLLGARDHRSVLKALRKCKRQVTKHLPPAIPPVPTLQILP